MEISEGLGGSGLFFSNTKPYSRVFNGNVDYVVVPLDGTEAPTASPSDSPSELPSSSPTVLTCDTDEDCLQRDYADFLACTEFTTCDATSNTCVGGCNCDGIWTIRTVEPKTQVIAPPIAQLSSRSLQETTELNGAQGNMFDVDTKTAVQITSFDIKVTGTGNYTAIVFMKAGSYVGFDGNSAAWTLVHTETVTGQGPGIFTPLGRFSNPVVLPANVTHAFYVMVTSGNFVYTRHAMDYRFPKATVVDETDHLTLFSGLGKSVEDLYPVHSRRLLWPNVAHKYANPNQSRTWNGIVHYVVPDDPARANFGATPEPTPEPTPFRRRTDT